MIGLQQQYMQDHCRPQLPPHNPDVNTLCAGTPSQQMPCVNAHCADSHCRLPTAVSTGASLLGCMASTVA